MQNHLLALLLILCALFMFIPLAKIIYGKQRRKKLYTRILHQVDALYVNTDPYRISKEARQQDPDFLYGEIEICTLLDLVAFTKPVAKQVFYDLGSGCGKTLLAVKLGYPLLKVKGIEILEALHLLALQKQEAYIKQHPCADTLDWEIIHHNFIFVDLQDADIVFINATAYSGATWHQILDKLMQLHPGTKVIITSKSLPTPYFIKRYQGMEWMSWGPTSTYIYEKAH